MTAATDSSPRPGSRIGLQLVLVAVATAEVALALSDFPSAFTPHDGYGGPAQAGIDAGLAAHPLFAIAALVLAAVGRLRAAIVALATSMLFVWAADLPAAFAQGRLEWDTSFDGLQTLAMQAIYPLLAIAAIALAWRGTWLWPAAVLVAIPPVNLLVGLVIFIVAVVNHGI